MKEALLEPFLREKRIKRVLPILTQFPECSLLDVGCGFDATFLKTVEPYIASGVGVDFKAPSHIDSVKLKTSRLMLNDKLPFEDNSFDVVTCMAVLEHLEKPLDICTNIYRVLKKDGIFVGTVPTKASKPLLEFLSYKLGIVNEMEIRDHKQYFNKKDLEILFTEVGFLEMKHTYFQCGMNNFWCVRKN